MTRLLAWWRSCRRRMFLRALLPASRLHAYKLLLLGDEDDAA